MIWVANAKGEVVCDKEDDQFKATEVRGRSEAKAGYIKTPEKWHAFMDSLPKRAIDAKHYFVGKRREDGTVHAESAANFRAYSFEEADRWVSKHF